MTNGYIGLAGIKCDLKASQPLTFTSLKPFWRASDHLAEIRHVVRAAHLTDHFALRIGRFEREPKVFPERALYL